MTEAPFIIVKINDLSATNAFGAILAEHLIDPHVIGFNPVVVAYAPIDSGKTTLKMSIDHAFHENDKKIDIKHADDGGPYTENTYPSILPTSKDIFGSPKALKFVDAGNKIHWIEHPTGGTLLFADMAVFLLRDQKKFFRLSMPAYFNRMANNLEMSAQSRGLKSRAVDIVVDHLRQAADTKPENGEAIARIVLLSEKEELLKAFEKTKQTIAERGGIDGLKILTAGEEPKRRKSIYASSLSLFQNLPFMRGYAK